MNLSVSSKSPCLLQAQQNPCITTVSRVSFLTGGGSPRIRYHRADGSVRDTPSEESPIHPGTWSVHGMKPEPMHAIEVVAVPKKQLDNSTWASPPSG
jgi:hypothetical protein